MPPIGPSPALMNYWICSEVLVLQSRIVWNFPFEGPPVASGIYLIPTHVGIVLVTHRQWETRESD